MVVDKEHIKLKSMHKAKNVKCGIMSFVWYSIGFRKKIIAAVTFTGFMKNGLRQNLIW